MKTTWTHGGVPFEIVTTRGASETDPALWARHRAACAAIETEDFQPDYGTTLKTEWLPK
jgi:hypothetical protein